MNARLALRLIGPLVAVAAIVSSPVPASAHGERAQESFIRMETVGFWDTHFSSTTVRQSEELTLSETIKLLETWPINLSNGNPSVCYLTVVQPRAQFVLKDRVVNGLETPQSMFCKKGGVYEYSMTIAGRGVGTWHVHPAIAVEQSGTIIGPGQWITVNAAAGGFSYPVKLLNGQTVDLESYGTPLILVFSLLTFVLGMAWMIYWTWSKPTITR